MQFKLLVLSALTAAASAQTASLKPSDVAALLTALPSSDLSLAEASPTAFASEISSEFAAGNTPSWFTKLPTGVQSDLLAANSSVATAGGASRNSTHGASNATTHGAGPTTRHGGIAGNTQLTPTNTASTASGSASGSSGSSGSSSSSSSSGGASLPTAVVGAGIAGFVGIVGLFAL